MTTNKQWLLKSRPEGLFKTTDFQWQESPLPKKLKKGQVLTRVVYLSMDPTYRGWAAGDTYVAAVPLDTVMRGICIGVVEASRNDRFSKGDVVQGMMGWQTHYVSDGSDLAVLPSTPGIPLDAHFGLFGHIGLTAYFGLIDIAQPQKGETIVVSGAAGAVGSLVAQLGKIQGCRVVGIAGSDEKCDYLVDELGIDSAINYKTENVAEALQMTCPKGIDVYFDNVGGTISDAVLGQINIGARITLCGLIAQYNATEPVPGPYNYANILIKRARVQGMIVFDFLDRALEAIMPMAGWYGEGKLKYRTHIIDGLENAPEAVNMLFSGENNGKLIVQVSELP